MKVYIAIYDDGTCPEQDVKIVGIFMGKESAERAINNEIMFHYDPKYPNKNLSNRHCYSIVEHEVYD